MKKKLLIVIAVIILSVIPLSFVYAVEAFHAPTKDGLKTEVTYWDKDKAYNGYTVFYPRMAPEVMAKIFLIDMAGNVVHTWPGGNNPKLMENGHILSTLTEMDWDGNQVWRGQTSARVHHDTWRIYNKKLKAYTTIGLTREQDYTAKNAVAAGADPSVDYADIGAYADGLVEIDMDGNIIWSWTFLDHVIQDKDPNRPNYVGKGKTIADYPGKLDLNWITDQNRRNDTPGITSDWQHTNALDYNEELDHIAVNAKHWSEFYVVDHGATFVPNDPQKSIELAASDAGDFIYRFGNPSAYQQGKPQGNKDEGDYQMYGSHNIEWIDKGLPGAGNFSIYDNGCYNPMGRTSSAIEINPFLDANGKNTGNYVNPPDAGYNSKNISNQVVWSFESYKGITFYSKNVSSAQRLPNGNTMICAGAQAHIFEVTRDGEVVWEYINPLGRSGLSKVIPASDRGNNSVFRAYRFGPDYPAFNGKDLKPMGKITEMFEGVTFDPSETESKGKGVAGGGRGGKGGGRRGGKGGGGKGGKGGGGKKGGSAEPEEDEPEEEAFLPY